MHAYNYDRSAAHGAQWQELQQHGNMHQRREGSSVCVT